jgi:GntR family transcriptional regulator
MKRSAQRISKRAGTPAKRGRTMYQQIANTLRDRISYGVYPENQMLPPEMLLLAEFDVSRHTVREAMKALVAEGLIERKAGRGTVVSPRSKLSGAWGVRSINDLIGEFNDSQIVLLKRGVVSARSFPQVAELFSLRSSGSLFCIQRVINLKQGPTAFHRLFTLVRYASRIPKEELGYKPLIGQIEQYCRVQAYRTRQVASATEADADVAKLLGIRRGTPMLTLRRTYMSHDDEPIEYTELVCRSDRYTQTVDFYREPLPKNAAASGP